MIAEGTPGELKSQVGGERLDIHLCDDAARGGGRCRAGRDRQRPAVPRGRLRPRPGRRAPGDDRRGGPPARRRRDRDRRHLGQLADAGRRLPDPDRARGRAGGRRGGGAGGDRACATASPTRSCWRSAACCGSRASPTCSSASRSSRSSSSCSSSTSSAGRSRRPGFDYVDFLIPGIIVQSIVFGGFVTALGLSDDLKKGLIDRFRSLPMTRSALLTGRTLGDVVTNIFQLVVMFTVGLLIGFNFSSSVGEVVAGILLMLLIGYAFSWVFAFIGLSSSSPEAANAYRLHDPLPGHVRLVGVRPGRDDAELAPADRRAQPVHLHGQRRPRAVPRHPGRGQRLAGARLDARDHRRLRSALGVEVPARRRAVRSGATAVSPAT